MWAVKVVLCVLYRQSGKQERERGEPSLAIHSHLAKRGI